ncbi:Calcipressin-3 Regulator of calcineurin 3 [Collichthys lucidus]|uniref:Calcipressin-3 Regulator of calcineurin 3 n=1 Tax=Collichthys lucidus TaxID=240159 RepID=A0A4U5VFE1_COLLU|nr:Calcipressin-3 Regulator of calcineurin 3 [Collichthys lucidus]
MLRETSKAWSNGSEAYSSDPEEDEEEEEDMVFGETDQDGMAEEMMDLSDLPTALFACSVHEAVFEEDSHRLVSFSQVYPPISLCCKSPKAIHSPSSPSF